MLALASCAVGVFDQPFGVWLVVDALCAVLLVTAGVAVLRARRGQPRGILPAASLLVLSLAVCSVLTTVWTAVAALTYTGGCTPSVASWPVVPVRVAPGDTGYRRAPLWYALNELRDMLDLREAAVS